jgi:hypothetical protein
VVVPGSGLHVRCTRQLASQLSRLMDQDGQMLRANPNIAISKTQRQKRDFFATSITINTSSIIF